MTASRWVGGSALTFVDLDHDGDLDLFFSDHHDAGLAALNDGAGHFTAASGTYATGGAPTSAAGAASGGATAGAPPTNARGGVTQGGAATADTATTTQTDAGCGCRIHVPGKPTAALWLSLVGVCFLSGAARSAPSPPNPSAD